MNEFIKLLNNYLKINEISEQKWCIRNSSLNGRGLFAAQDIEIGEIILKDTPILIGPRNNTKIKLFCVICARINNIKVCSKGCGLPVCSIYCELSIQHLKECALIRNLLKNDKLKNICVDIFRALTPLRSLLLENTLKTFISNLSYFDDPKHGFEIELVKKHLNFSESQEIFLKSVCSVLNSNTFQCFKCADDKNKVSLRGLYILSSFINHSCVPNSTYYFDCNQFMTIKASKEIKKGEEILTSYTNLFYGTTSRRYHLASARNFWCTCQRCNDPKEFGSNLSGLKCISKDCLGILFPLNPIDLSTKWICDICELIVPNQKIRVIQNSLGSLLKSIDVSNLSKLIDFWRYRLHIVVSPQNQIAIEIKLKILWMLGYTENYFWKDLSKEHLKIKENLCRDLLELCRILKLENTTLEGQFFYELYKCLKEKMLRIQFDNISKNKKKKDLEKWADQFFSKALEILRDDITAPLEIKKYMKENCKK